MSDYYDEVMKKAEEMEQPWREKQLADAGRSLAQEVRKLRNLNAELLQAAKGVCDGFEAGVFIRNTSNDHESGWAIKAYPYLRHLFKLAKATEKAEALK
jgi:hypothetical protein